MAKTSYTWKTGSRISAVSADIAGKELERIRKEHQGSFEPGVVVDEARPDTSPLHPAFEWDDSIAAEEHRREQAKYMVRALVVVSCDRYGNQSNEDDEPQRVYVSVKQLGATKPAYTTVTAAMSSPTLRQQVLSAALRDMQAFAARYYNLVEVADVLTAIKTAGKRVEAALSK